MPLRARRRGWQVALAAFLALSLVSGGFALGSVLSEADTPEAQTLRPVSSDTADSGNEGEPSGSSVDPVPLEVPDPLTDLDEEEPVVAVAQAVSPSVVQILAGFGQGSGIVWDAGDGYIVTNQHVVEGVTDVEVIFANGKQASGTVIGGSSNQDVAVVQVDPAGLDLQAAAFAPTSTVEVGQLAVAVGSPFGLDQTITSGIVSAVRINTFGGSDPNNPVPVEMIQTDAPINPGNSGGALADRQGRVVGMNTSIRTDGSNGNLGVGFAVPSDTIVLIAQRIVNGESLALGFLGVSSEVDAPDGSGVLITSVVDNSPASDVGLAVGDLIIALEGSEMIDIAELSAAIKLYRPGDEVQLTIERDGDTFVADVVLGVAG